FIGFVECRCDQVAVVRIGPAMIWATEYLLVAALVVADEVGAMPAAVEECTQLVVLASHQDDGLQPDLPADIVTAVWHFAFVPEIDPEPAEDVLHLPLEQLCVVVDPAMNAIGQDQFANVNTWRCGGAWHGETLQFGSMMKTAGRPVKQTGRAVRYSFSAGNSWRVAQSFAKRVTSGCSLS